MNVPKPKPPEVRSRPADGPQQSLEAVLDLQPFPCLVVEAGTAHVLFRNAAACQAGAGLPGGAKAPDSAFATDAAGRRMEADQVVCWLTTCVADAGGVEVAWHVAEREVCFRVYAREVPPIDGRASLVLLTFLDCTAQRAAETELRQALQARDEWFSVATHELKDPLFSLQLSIQLLRHSAGKLGAVPPHVRHHLEVSQRQAERLGRLIDNLLDVSRIVNQQLQVEPEPFDLTDLVREVAARFQEKARSTGAALTVEAAGPLPGEFDRMKLEQVLTNLLSNALKYGAGQPVVVRARADGGDAVLEVEDRGPGIAPEDQPRVFRRFERASGSHKKESLGLGLYIVRSLVEAHGGGVQLRSAPGAGTTFTVRLPLNRIPGAGPDAGPAEQE